MSVIDFDEADALERTAGDLSILVEVIRFTLEDIPQIISELVISIRDDNRQETARLAHKIKGSAGAAGAQVLFLAALDLELAAKDSDANCSRFQAPLLAAFDSFRSHPDVIRLSSLDLRGDASIG